MKIEKNDKPTATLNLVPGDVYEKDGEYYVLTDDSIADYRYGFTSLATGERYSRGEWLVEYEVVEHGFRHVPNARLVIE